MGLFADQKATDADHEDRPQQECVMSLDEPSTEASRKLGPERDAPGRPPRLLGQARGRFRDLQTEKPWIGYAVAIAGTALAAMVRWVLELLVGPGLPEFITFYIVVVISALLAGAWAGILATVLSALWVVFLLSSIGQFTLAQPAGQISFLLFFAINALASLICGNLRSARVRSLGEAHRAEASAHQLAEVLKAEQSKLAAVIENLPVGIGIATPKGETLLLNKTGLDIFGFRFEGDLFSHISRDEDQVEIGYLDGRPMPLDEWPRARANRGEYVRDYEVCLRNRATGVRRFVSYNVAPVRNTHGETVLNVFVIQDITQRKEADAILTNQARLERLRADAAAVLQHPADTPVLLQEVSVLLVDALHAAFARVWTLDSTGQILELKASAGLYTHLDGEHSRVRLGQFKIGRIAQQREPHVTNQVVGDPNVPHQDWARREGLIAFAGYPLLREGQLLGVVAMFARHELAPSEVETFAAVSAMLAQTLARKKAEADLQASEERFRQLADSMPQIVWAARPDGCLDYYNRRWFELTGAAEGQIGDQSWLPILHPEDRQRCLDVWYHSIQTGAPYRIEYRFRFPGTGDYRWYLGRALPVRDQHGNIVRWYGSSTDIHDLKQIQAVLELQNRRLQCLQETATELLAGREPAQIIRHLHSCLHDYFQVDVFMLYQAENAGDLRLRASGGLTPEEEQHCAALRFGQAICSKQPVCQPIIATGIQHVESPNQRFIKRLGFRVYLSYPLIVGDRLLGSLAFASRSRDTLDSADQDFFQTIAQSVAEALERERLRTEIQRHAAQLERLVQERTARLQEMVNELEHFSYTITHDMRAPLRAMRGFSSMLLEEYSHSLDSHPRDLLRRIDQAAKRMDHLITDALQYSHAILNQVQLSPVNPVALLRGLVESYPQFQPPQAEIHIQEPMPAVLGNEAAMTQCFSNLLDNAVKFVPPGVVPRVRVWAESMEENGAGTAAGFVRFWFEDNGIGMDPAYQDRIFHMFERLERHYEGTGIGLALVRKVVQRMGGNVGVISSPGAGSRFWVELRALDQPVPLEPARDAPGALLEEVER